MERKPNVRRINGIKTHLERLTDDELAQGLIYTGEAIERATRDQNALLDELHVRFNPELPLGNTALQDTIEFEPIQPPRWPRCRVMARSFGERHHILHHGKLHEATKDNRYMRTKAVGMIALLDPDVHDALHIACPGVPPPDLFTAGRIKKHYEPNKDPNIAVVNYMRAVEEAMKSPKSHEIERSLAELVIMAVDLQRPFIKEGLIIPNE